MSHSRPDLEVTFLFAVGRNHKKIKQLHRQHFASDIFSQLEWDDQKLAKKRSMLLENWKIAKTCYLKKNKKKTGTDVCKNIHISSFMETQTDQ